MHDMSNTRKEIAARLGFAARFGRDYPSKVTETAGVSGGTWSKKMARYGSKKAAVITYTDGGQVGQVYQDPDNPRVFKAFDMGGRLLGEGSEMDMKRKVEAITASRPGAKVSFDTYTDLVNELRRFTADSANVQYDWYTAANTWLGRKRTSGNKEIAVEANRAYDAVEREMRPKWRQSRPGAKSSFGRAEDVYRLLETTPGSYANYKKRDALTTEAMRLADITPAGKDVSLHELAEMVGQDLEADRSRMSRPGTKTRMTREQTEEQKAGLKIMSAADPVVGAKIAKLIKEGKPQDQAVAIALDMKRRGEL